MSESKEKNKGENAILAYLNIKWSSDNARHDQNQLYIALLSFIISIFQAN